jgi:hypothetical protein
MMSQLKKESLDDDPDSPLKNVADIPKAKKLEAYNEHIGIDIQSKGEDSYSMGLE